jgi:hypothetical protein
LLSTKWGNDAIIFDLGNITMEKISGRWNKEG